MRIVNSAYTPFDTPKPSTAVKPQPSQPNGAVLVSPDGSMYAIGPVLAVTLRADGDRILTFKENTGVAIMVSAETLKILNPGS